MALRIPLAIQKLGPQPYPLLSFGRGRGTLPFRCVTPKTKRGKHNRDCIGAGVQVSAKTQPPLRRARDLAGDKNHQAPQQNDLQFDVGKVIEQKSGRSKEE
jgi:hypothetical protein